MATESNLFDSILGNAYMTQIIDLIDANAWQGQFQLEWIESLNAVRVRLSDRHPIAPNEIVNEYREETNPLEQVQQECLRALRTGSPGI